MQKTINAKWSEITGNRKDLDETIIGKGIELQSLVNSDELNSIVNRQDEMLDDLQRGSAWNIGKEYNQGDMVFVNVNYKRLSDSVGKTYKCFVICKQEKVKAEPFINKANKAIAFSKNYDYAVTQFIIQVDDDSTALTHFINDDFWDFVRLDNDLRNATRLNVSNEAKLGIQGKDSSIITFDRDIILNSNLDTKGTFDIKGNLTGGSLNSNNNIAWGSAFVKTPAYNAKGDEIVNAEWLNVNDNGLLWVGNRNDIWYRNFEIKTQINMYNTYQFYKIVPQDFEIEMFNSIVCFGAILDYVQHWYVPLRYISIRGLNLDILYKKKEIYNIIDSMVYYMGINMTVIENALEKMIKFANKIKVDFSQSFEIYVEEYFKKYTLDIYVEHMGYSTIYTKDNKKIDYPSVITWDKERRLLGFTFRNMYYLYNRYVTMKASMIKLSTI